MSFFDERKDGNCRYVNIQVNKYPSHHTGRSSVGVGHVGLVHAGRRVGVTRRSAVRQTQRIVTATATCKYKPYSHSVSVSVHFRFRLVVSFSKVAVSINYNLSFGFAYLQFQFQFQLLTIPVSDSIIFIFHFSQFQQVSKTNRISVSNTSITRSQRHPVGTYG